MLGEICLDSQITAIITGMENLAGFAGYLLNKSPRP